MIRAISCVLSLAFSISPLGCSGKDTSPAAPPTDWSAGRGSAACREWQRSFCEYAAKCGSTTLVSCATQMQQLSCNSDTNASNCATSLDAAACGAAPIGCNMTDIVDSAPAVQGCNDLLTAVCTHDSNCGSTPAIATCVTQQLTSLNCSNAIGLALNYQDCLSKLNTAACTASFPKECNDVVLLN